jgi:transposase-like protein
MMNDKKRTYYSKDFKRKALYEVINGADFEDVLRKFGIDVDSLIKNDKKYCSKLLSKWKKEVYENNEMLYLINSKISNSDIENELRFLVDDDENDCIMDDIKTKIKNGVKNYKKIKNQLLSIHKKIVKNKK